MNLGSKERSLDNTVVLIKTVTMLKVGKKVLCATNLGQKIAFTVKSEFWFL